jgi:aldose 1-epimerase
MVSALDTACFPLVPYANRIEHGRFRFAGKTVEVPLNFEDHPHSLHGTGWQNRWRVIEQDDDRLAMIHDHDGETAWPWRYSCTQHLVLAGSGLSATLRLVNDDTRPMPGGLGFHPYLAAHPGDRLIFRCTETWLTDETQLATRAAAADAIADWRAGADVFRSELVDHCHGGWAGTAELAGEARTVRLHATGASFLHVHIPPGLDHVGIEPVSHMPNAVNRAEPPLLTGLRILAPGEAMTIDMQITIA